METFDSNKEDGIMYEIGKYLKMERALVTDASKSSTHSTNIM
jgi:hypothetical protein